MKKIFLSVLFVFAFFSVFSQQKFHAPLAVNPVSMAPENFSSSLSSSAALTSFRIDYYAREFAIWNPPPTTYFGNFIWPMNGHYTGVDSAWSYCIVAYDSIYDYTDSTGYNTTSFSSLKVDSIYLTAGHENFSGTMDTIIAKILTVDNVGYPTNTVLWSDTIFTNVGLSILNNYLFNTTLKFYPGITIPGGKFAVRMDYYGALQDTFGFLAGYGYSMGTCMTPASFNLAQNTHFSKVGSGAFTFFANSFAYWTQPGLNAQLPSSTGGSVYYECNGVTGQQAVGDGNNYMQNINMGAYVTIDQSLGMTISPAVNICIGRTTTLTGSHLAGTPPYHYQWAPVTGLSCDTCAVTAANPTNTTTYTLTITDGVNTVSDTVTVGIANNNVVSSFTSSATNLTVVYTNTSQNASNYYWTFGAGATPATSILAGPVTVHYNSSGTKTVSLIATQISTLCNDSSGQQIEISNTGIDENYSGEEVALFQNIPNPFNNKTEISYELKKNSRVEIEISDIAGRKVKTIPETNQVPGIYLVSLAASDFSPGIYFYTIRVNGFALTRKMAVE